MTMSRAPKHHRYPVLIINQAVWSYHKFNHSYRDVQEQLVFRGIIVSHETIRAWSIKFSLPFKDVVKKRKRKPTDKWHLDEMTLRVHG